MKKFVTAIIISFVITVSSAASKPLLFPHQNLGAAFDFEAMLCQMEKNDKNRQWYNCHRRQ